MNVAHTQGMATLLPDGQVLVTGANSGGGAPLPSPELYNPAAGTWAVTGQMNTPRIDATPLAHRQRPGRRRLRRRQ